MNITGKYHFKHYTIDRYTFVREENKPPFIETDVTLECRDGQLAGKICSQFGEGEIECVSQWSEDICCFGGDMGGGRRVWWSLVKDGEVLKGTVMPWEEYSAVKWPLFFEGEKVKEDGTGLAGVYYLRYYNANLDTEKKEGPVMSTAYLFLEEKNGKIDGKLDYPVGKGIVSEAEIKDGLLFFRVDYAGDSNTWYRARLDGTKLEGDVTPYPFHFAWPFIVEGICEN